VETVYRVRLHFAELEEVASGRREFDVLVGDRTAANKIDVVKEAGQRNRAIVREFRTAAANGKLTVSLTARTGAPILNGLEILAQAPNVACR
jgi:hypothetical protein